MMHTIRRTTSAFQPAAQHILRSRQVSSVPQLIQRPIGGIGGAYNQNSHVTTSRFSYSPSWGNRSCIQDPLYRYQSAQSSFSSTSNSSNRDDTIKLSKLITTYGQTMSMSRRSAQNLIQAGQVTISGQVVVDPGHILTIDEAWRSNIKVAGRALVLRPLQPPPQQNREGSTPTAAPLTQKSLPVRHIRVWLAHKLSGELVSEHDPIDRPSMMDRLARGGVGKAKKGKPAIHLKPVGRLDMSTEGLVIVTNDGAYARELELPSMKLHRTYRARVHGRVTLGKLTALRKGLTVNGIKYEGIGIEMEVAQGRRGRGGNRRGPAPLRAKGGNTNSWFRITCTQGKNRQIRRMLAHVGLTVNRLIRISFGDYDLNTIPPGMALEVPYKPLEGHTKRGELKRQRTTTKTTEGDKALAEEDQATVQWIRHV